MAQPTSDAISQGRRCEGSEERGAGGCRRREGPAGGGDREEEADGQCDVRHALDRRYMGKRAESGVRHPQEIINGCGGCDGNATHAGTASSLPACLPARTPACLPASVCVCVCVWLLCCGEVTA